MNSKKVVTNLRIDREDLLQIKAMAAELGMSVNEYVNYLVKDLSAKRELLGEKFVSPIWKLSEISRRVKVKPLGKSSSEDKIIYG